MCVGASKSISRPQKIKLRQDRTPQFLNPWIRHCKLCLHINLVLRDSAEVFYEVVNDNSAWKMILFKIIREIVLSVRWENPQYIT